MLMVRSAGIRLHARIDGPAAAPAVLLLNSLGTDLRMWDGVAGRLARSFRVVRFDKPGHGLSESGPRPGDIGGLAAHAASVLDAFGVATAHVIGVSIGGQIAMALAEARPDRVDRLVLSNTAARIGSAAMWSERIAALERDGIAPMADAVLERWFSPSWRAKHADELAGWRAMLCRCEPAGYLACCDALAAADLTGACEALRRPVLVVAGSADGATPAALVQATAARIEGAAFACIDGVGHLPCIEDEAAFLELVEGFLAAPKARAASA